MDGDGGSQRDTEHERTEPPTPDRPHHGGAIDWPALDIETACRMLRSALLAARGADATERRLLLVRLSRHWCQAADRQLARVLKEAEEIEGR